MPKKFIRPPYFSQEHDSWVIPLTQGVIALVDEDIAQAIGYRHWHAFSHRNERWYAVTNTETHPKRLLRMHRVILDPADELEVDHRYHFPFVAKVVDNRRSNLRLCTGVLNSQNRRKQSNRSNPFKGVFQVGHRWRAKITIHKRDVHLGYFPTAIKAAEAYDAAARDLHGEYAVTNESLGLMKRAVL